jgi:hypothetical protein
VQKSLPENECIGGPDTEWRGDEIGSENAAAQKTQTSIIYISTNHLLETKKKNLKKPCRAGPYFHCPHSLATTAVQTQR